MFQTAIETRVGIPSSVDHFFAFGGKPLHFSAALNLCRDRLPATEDCDALRFAAAVRKLSSRHAFQPTFTAADWRIFSSFCIARRLRPDFRVQIPGQVDRTLRFVVEGSLWTQSPASTRPGASQPRLILPGTMLGEDSLFSDAPGEADVRTLEDSLVLELSLPRQKELTAAHPAIAFELLRAAGAVIAARGRPVEARAELATN